MPTYETYSKRQHQMQYGDKADFFSYDILPAKFRVQVVHILKDAIGGYATPDPYGMDYLQGSRGNNAAWEYIHDTLCREMGRHYLGRPEYSKFGRCLKFIEEAEAIEVLDLIELAFKVVTKVITEQNDYQRQLAGVSATAEEAIEELNARFRENGLGYKFEHEQIIRIDSELIHEEVIRPALTLLRDHDFKGALDEFMGAHEHYLHGRSEESLQDALKAFESTIKIICGRLNWAFSPKDTSARLVEIIFKNELIPSAMTNHYSGLRSMLEAGVPTLRNNMAGHGQGEEVRVVPPYVTAYGLHMAASAIVFLIEAYKSKWNTVQESRGAG
jgi:hypothetical protein